MSNIVIGKYFKTEEAAAAGAADMMREHRQPYYVMCGKSGFLVITEAQAKKLRPDLFPKRRYATFTKEYSGSLYTAEELRDFMEI
jgi:hypothetical protein